MTSTLLRCVVALAAAAGVALLSAPGGVLGEEKECAVPESFYTFEPLLTNTPKAVAGGREMVIVVLGGSSTVGRAAGGSDLAWPARLASALAGKFPSARTKVVNLAMARQTAKEAADRMDRDVLPLKATLVIWETGTMEAVRGADVDEFRKTVQAGIDALHAAGVEVVLMNMQFSRDTHAMIDFEPYLVVLSELADANDVPLFRRHGIMRHWSEGGMLDYRARDGEKRRQVAAKLYDCIGRAMANFLTRGLHASEPASSSKSRR
jgi:lysophospholipase L1-like esterase